MAKINHNLDLPAANTFYRDVLNLAGIAIMTLQSDRSIQFINLEALKLFGYKFDDKLVSAPSADPI